MPKRNDIILIILLILFSFILLVGLYRSQDQGNKVVIKVDGRVHQEFSLADDLNYTINLENGEYNELLIREGYAEVIGASCHNQICVNHKKIQKSGETIVCLPNRVIIEIDGDNKSDLDGIAN